MNYHVFFLCVENNVLRMPTHQYVLGIIFPNCHTELQINHLCFCYIILYDILEVGHSETGQVKNERRRSIVTNKLIFGFLSYYLKDVL